MTLYLARKVGSDGLVDETATVYLGRCDDGDDCRYLADHRDVQVVEDALAGHRARAHATALKGRPEDATRTGWLNFTGPIAGEGTGLWASARSDHDASGGRPTDPPAGPGWAPANDPHLPPSPTTREQRCRHEWSVDAGRGQGYTASCGRPAGHDGDHEEAR